MDGLKNSESFLPSDFRSYMAATMDNADHSRYTAQGTEMRHQIVTQISTTESLTAATTATTQPTSDLSVPIQAPNVAKETIKAAFKVHSN
jgi:hypothetical protein